MTTRGRGHPEFPLLLYLVCSAEFRAFIIFLIKISNFLLLLFHLSLLTRCPFARALSALYHCPLNDLLPLALSSQPSTPRRQTHSGSVLLSRTCLTMPIQDLLHHLLPHPPLPLVSRRRIRLPQDSLSNSFLLSYPHGPPL
jgi:hypothetical protein